MLLINSESCFDTRIFMVAINRTFAGRISSAIDTFSVQPHLGTLPRPASLLFNYILKKTRIKNTFLLLFFFSIRKKIKVHLNIDIPLSGFNSKLVMVLKRVCNV